MKGEGWFHTGDVAVMDEDGYPTIVDRLKEMIITGGFNVYPSEEGFHPVAPPRRSRRGGATAAMRNGAGRRGAEAKVTRTEAAHHRCKPVTKASGTNAQQSSSLCCVKEAADVAVQQANIEKDRLHRSAR